jgi:STE24 endopeptidase
VDGLPWWARAPLYAGLVVVVSTLVRLPLAFWRGHVRERRWGFSTQSARGWLSDAAKGLVVGALLTALALTGLVAAARWLPSSWPLVAVPVAVAFAALTQFVAPVLLEPLFNRFGPLRDDALARDLLALAERAGAPVRGVLVADASRRTRKVNAYVSGLGRTRRVVLYDTLLEQADAPQVKLIVAHELGHRRHGDVAKGTLLLMAGAAIATLVVWTLVHDPADPRRVPLVLLVLLALELVAMPLGAWVSRRWERAADLFSLELTGDRDAYLRAHTELALSNLSDLDPPRAIYALLFSHPTPPERLALAG